MSSAWHNSWGSSWGNSWGYLADAQVGVVENRLVPISFSTSGLHEVVAGVNNVVVRVVAYMLVAANTVTVTFRSGTTTLTGAMTMVVGRPIKARGPRPYAVARLPRECVLQTAPGQALNLALSAGVAVSGFMVVQRVSRT